MFLPCHVRSLHLQIRIVLQWQLRLAAKKCLSAPSTSVARQQVFSRADQVYDKRRHSLIFEKAEKPLFLYYNIRLFNFIY